MNYHIEINNRLVGKKNPVYIIAEMSANHNQDFDKAVKIIEAAVEKLPDNSIFTGFNLLPLVIGRDYYIQFCENL